MKCRSWAFWYDAGFWSTLILYVINKKWRFFEAEKSPLSGHFNDLLLIPVALPLVLQVQSWVKLRKREGAPSWKETFLHVAVWSVVCEWIGPQWLGLGTADIWDVVCYSMGAALAQLWWNRWKLSPTSH